jgi:anti-anti-sigma factor
VSGFSARSSTDYSLDVQILDSSLVVSASGELDLNAAPDLREFLEQFQGRHFVLDFASVTFVDSTILAVLVAFHRRHETAGGSMTLRGVRPTQLRLFELSGVSTTLRIEAPPV